MLLFPFDTVVDGVRAFVVTVEIFDDDEQVAADYGDANLSYKESQRPTQQFLENNLTSI